VSRKIFALEKNIFPETVFVDFLISLKKLSLKKLSLKKLSLKKLSLKKL
jgi:hypothetical protein